MQRWAFVGLVRVVAATWLISNVSVPKPIYDHASYGNYFILLRPTIIRASYNMCKMTGQ